jgi:hypothetical protein
MAIRSEKLNRLVIGSECKAAWDDMHGHGERRFCAECQREVFDFAQMTEREIRARIEASRGQLCARLTKRAGQLVVAQPAEPFSLPSPWERRHVSPFAATVVTAWLSLGAAQAQPTPASAPAVSSPEDGADRSAAPDRSAKSHAALTGTAAFGGRVLDEGGLPLQGVDIVARNALDGRQHATSTDADGRFALEQLPTGVYDLTATLQGFDITPRNDISLQTGDDRSVDLTATADRGSALMGALMVVAEPLRRLVAESDLVVAARVGPSTGLTPGELADVTVELQIESLLKGSVAGRTVAYRPAARRLATELVPGSRVLAFLKASLATDGSRETPRFESADYFRGVRVLGDAEHVAYVERLEALARLRRKAERRGEQDPGELMEWLVATTEDPYTRHETVFEIRGAVGALAEIAERDGITVTAAAADLKALIDRFRGEGGKLSEEPRPAFLGAALTDGQKERLTAALSAAERLADVDLALFGIVRTWDDKAATAWLVRQLRTGVSEEDYAGEIWRLQRLAAELQNESITELVEAAGLREQELKGRGSADEPEAKRELAALVEDLRHRLAEELASAR